MHPCNRYLQNVNHSYVIITLITNTSYVSYASALGRSLELTSQKYPRIAVSTVNYDQSILEEWKSCSVTPLSSRRPPSERKLRFVHSKLYLFSFSRFERILFLDADTIATGPVDVFFSYPLPVTVNIFAMKDIKYGKGFVNDEINTGVMVIRPNPVLYRRSLLKLRHYRELTRGGQKFMTRFFKNVTDNSMPVQMHGHLGVYSWRHNFWPSDKLPTILHYTIIKPHKDYDCNFIPKYAYFCRIWKIHSAHSNLKIF